MREVRKGYMCLTDFDFELGEAPGGNRIFTSAEECFKDLKCAESCGVAEVEVRKIAVLREAPARA